MKNTYLNRPIFISIILSVLMILGFFASAKAVDNPQSGGVGLEGKISSPAPVQAPTISTPTNGQVFSTLPVTVRGICNSNYLVKLFKNNVFSGSAVCQNGSYSIQIDLFSAKNEIVARHYDALDQGGPDSNIVSIVFNDNANKVDISSKISMTSSYARKGANPNQQLSWPVVITGGVPPYAVSVDWGDGTTNDLYTVTVPGEFFIKHKFEAAGSYRALIKSTDKNGSIAFLQLVAIANGEAKDTAVAGATAEKNQAGTGATKILWQPVVVALPFILLTFWLGKKYEIKRIKQKLEHGEHPFQ